MTAEYTDWPTKGCAGVPGKPLSECAKEETFHHLKHYWKSFFENWTGTAKMMQQRLIGNK